MQSSPWVNLLQKIPLEQHGSLVLVSMAGIEFALQQLLTLDGDCLAFKGRLSGCQDTGRLFFIPYDKIVYVGFNRSVTEEEYRSWFGQGPTTAPAETVAVDPVTDPASDVATAPPEGTPTDPRKLTPVPGTRLLGARQAALLERVRARTSTVP